MAGLEHDHDPGTLEYWLRRLRWIEERRTKEVEAALRAEYRRALAELRGSLGETFVRFADAAGALDFGAMFRLGDNARFLEEATRRVRSLGAVVEREVRAAVDEARRVAFEGTLAAGRALRTGDRGVWDAFAKAAGAARVGPEVVRAAAENPIDRLRLDGALQRNRRDVVYAVRRDITNGIMNGDRYETMARRVGETLDGDYKKALRVVRTEVHRVRQEGHYDGWDEVDAALVADGGAARVYKIWRTARDERVRPQRGLSKKTGKKLAPGGRADHVKMEGVALPLAEAFDLGHGVKALYPGGSGDAGNDIHCRCDLEFEVRGVAGIEEVGQGGIIKEQAPYFSPEPISDESVAGIEQHSAKELQSEHLKRLRETQQEVLKRAQGLELGTEVGASMPLDGGAVHWAQGEAGAGLVSIPWLEKPYIGLHNHPNNTPFSLQDYVNFYDTENMVALVAAGNGGPSYLIEKLADFDMKLFDKYIQKIVSDVAHGRTAQDIAFLEVFQDLIVNGGEYGIFVDFKRN